ncbi:hypothetical protein TL16_g03953 [Triparma laevis f. inornata]|uniref:Uncharacterized protein n=1 Tax=Triparma laevis f. inornata TaxID=1714386 RepID=A0A9W7A1W7_9STRA|nr:hypothetical protein TL16_g03953 [Triparma laevis f. inornata]
MTSPSQRIDAMLTEMEEKRIQFAPLESIMISNRVKNLTKQAVRPQRSNPVDSQVVHVKEEKKRRNKRRDSLKGAGSAEEQRAILESIDKPVIKVVGLGYATKEHCKEVSEQYLIVVRNSGGDVETDVRKWVQTSFPTEHMTPSETENITHILVFIAIQIRVLMKMSRIGVAVKMGLTLCLGYVDILTDFLVAKSYYDAGRFDTAYATGGFAVMAIVLQGVLTFFQKNFKERFWRMSTSLLGLGPLMEGASVWMGKEDTDSLLTPSVMYAVMKAIEISVESIPESIIQVVGLLKAKSTSDIQTIQIVGVISSIVSGAFIMMDGNFEFVLSRYLDSPGNPYWGWINKQGAWKKQRQRFGMFLFNTFYFLQFVFSMSLFTLSFSSNTPLILLLSTEFAVICLYMLSKKELFGWATTHHPSPLINWIFPIIPWLLEYMLVCAVPVTVAFVPMELGPEVFSGIVAWRLITNSGIIYVALGELENHYLTPTSIMMGYTVSSALALLGLFMFFRNVDENFDVNLFWRPKGGVQHMRERWEDAEIWVKTCKTKDEEHWSHVAAVNPTYLPFDKVTPWICTELVEKYADKNANVERPHWFNDEGGSKFIKRIIELYDWREKDKDEVNEALAKLFGGDALLEYGWHAMDHDEINDQLSEWGWWWWEGEQKHLNESE